MNEMSAAAEAIRKRMAQKRLEYENYRDHLKFRMAEEDAHGIWDGGACMSEVSNYIDALEFCLRAIEGEP